MAALVNLEVSIRENIVGIVDLDDREGGFALELDAGSRDLLCSDVTSADGIDQGIAFIINKMRDVSILLLAVLDINVDAGVKGIIHFKLDDLSVIVGRDVRDNAVNDFVPAWNTYGRHLDIRHNALLGSRADGFAGV